MMTKPVRQPAHVRRQPRRALGVRPKHDHEKQERVSYVASQISHEADDERANKRRRLLLCYKPRSTDDGQYKYIPYP